MTDGPPTPEEREAAIDAIARAYDVPVQVLTMSDEEFWRWVAAGPDGPGHQGYGQ